MSASTKFQGLLVAENAQKETLGRLPLEVLSGVFARLAYADIKSLWLNKFYLNVSSPYLMSRVILAARPQTVGAFNAILDHPILSKTITEIVYDASAFLEGDPEDVVWGATRPGSDEEDDEDTDYEEDTNYEDSRGF